MLIPNKYSGFSRDGIRRYNFDMGGGGGGGQPANTTQTTELPEWARPYAKNILAKGEALTDINQNPYQKYNQPRVASNDPLQDKAYNDAAGMTPAWQSGLGSQYAAQAGQYQPGQFGVNNVSTGSFVQPGTAQSYMSPYMQNVVDTQQREAIRQSDIQQGRNNAQAVGAGAFGGSRQALVEAERQRNLGTQLGNIQATGSQAAYEQAQNQFNQEQQKQLQAALANQSTGMQAQQLGEQSRQFGNSAALQAASTLGNLGGQQFQQGMDINKLQNAYGAQRQARNQQGLDIAYQDFMNQQNYPYRQLGFMSDLLRGTPTGSSSVTNMYAAQPSAMQAMSGLGLGAYGLSKFMASGGVTSEQNEESIISKLSDAQIQQALQAAKSRGDQDEVEMLSKEMAERASVRGGLGGAFNSLPNDKQLNVIQAAGGGILAFKDNGLVSGGSSSDDDGPSNTQEELVSRIADPNFQSELNKRGLSIADYLMKPSTYAAPTSAERLKYMSDYTKELQEAAGPSSSGEMKKYLQEQRDALGKEREEAKGIAALKAIPAVLDPRGLMQGLGGAAASIGDSMADVTKTQRAAKNQFAMMEFNLNDADRKERMGLHRDARAAFDESEKNKIAGLKLDRESKAAAGNVIGKLAQANRVTGKSGGAGGGPKEFIVGPATYLPAVRMQYPGLSEDEHKAIAFQKYQQNKAAGLEGVNVRTESSERETAAANARKRANVDSAWQTANREKDTEGVRKREQELFTEELGKLQKGGAGGAGMPKPGAGAGPNLGKPAAITPAEFDKKWATLKPNQTLMGPDGVLYTKQ
jgi:hypothetical protein